MSHDALIFLTGTIHPNDAPPYCRAGAEYMLLTEPVPFQLRLRPRGQDLLKRLAEAAIRRERVVLRGVFHREQAPGEHFVEVHQVESIVGVACCGPRGDDVGDGEAADVGDRTARRGEDPAQMGGFTA